MAKPKKPIPDDPAMENATQEPASAGFLLPTEGGRYERLRDGSLRKLGEAEESTTTLQETEA